jgi:hypothetical protein
MHAKKSKGDIGVAHAIARLTELGWNVGIPLTEHALYDLFAEKGGVVHTVQVRYATRSRGVIRVPLSTSYADRRGNHRRARRAGAFSLLAVYSPGNGVFFVAAECLGTNCREICLRLEPARNGQLKNIRLAELYREV